MKLYGKAQATANTILEAFQSPETLPKAVTHVLDAAQEIEAVAGKAVA